MTDDQKMLSGIDIKSFPKVFFVAFFGDPKTVGGSGPPEKGWLIREATAVRGDPTFQRLVVRSAAAAAFRSCARFRTAFQKSSSDKPSPSLMLCLERLSIA